MPTCLKAVLGGGTATWTQVAGSESYKFEWTGGGQSVSLFSAFGGTSGGELDWSEGVNLGFQPANTSTLDNAGKGYAVEIEANGKKFSRWMSFRTTPKSLTLTATSGDGFKKDGWGAYVTAADLQHVTDVKLVGDEYTTALSVDISDLYVTISPRASLVFNKEGKATIDLNKLDFSGGASYDAATHTITSDGTEGSAVKIVFDRTYDFSNMVSGTLTHSGDDIANNLVFEGSGHGGFYGSKYAPSFADQIGKGNYTAVTGFTLNLGTTAGTMVLSDISFTAKKMNIVDAHNIPIESLTNYTVDASGTVTAGSAVATKYGTLTDTPLGDGSGNMDNYIDIGNYDELRVYTSDVVRVFLFNVASPTTGTSTTPGNLVNVKDAAYFSYNTTDGYYYATVSDIKANNNGQAKVIGVKSSAYGEKATVSKVIVYKAATDYDYVVSGQYSSEVSLDDITNSDATAVDCTGLTAANLDITTQNPNCIFSVKKAGVLANVNNVAVENAIANLVLTDGKSLKVPAIDNLTATAATYSRTMSSTYGTICLPYEVTSNTDVEYYTISKLENNVLQLTKCETIAAGTPAIMKRLTGSGVTITAANAAVSGTVNTPSSAVTMYGSYTQGDKITAENAYFIYNDKFYKRALQTADVTAPYFYCDAFRACFTTVESNNAKSLSIMEDVSTPTFVDALAGDTDKVGIEGIYDAAGMKLPDLQKGMNIVRFTNGKTNTIIVK